MKIDPLKLNYPRPDMYRENWLSLNGAWEFCFDDSDEGIREKWMLSESFSRQIEVPFCYQSRKSGIADTSCHEIMWYAKNVPVNKFSQEDKLWLNFGAVDYKATVWVNGLFTFEHIGGYDSFAVEITPFIDMKSRYLRIVVRAEDRYNTWQPRGKQHWNKQPDRCWYIATSGIWQPVWIDVLKGDRIEYARLTPDIDRHEVACSLKITAKQNNARLLWTLIYDREVCSDGEIIIDSDRLNFSVYVSEGDPIDNHIRLWSAETPNLYTLKFELYTKDGTADKIETYFGMRKIERAENRVLLNYKPLYQRLVLAQGYWKESLLTPPDENALLSDLQTIKAMGFNGIRMHQKIEDPRFYYIADCLGLYVWSEMPSGYEFCDEEIQALADQWQKCVLRDYNHPSIITWVPLNESWGVRDILNNGRQQHFARALYSLTHALDKTRLVSTNDGWEQVQTDIVGIHDYEASGETLENKYSDWESLVKWQTAGKMLFANGTVYKGEPVIFSEFGGIAVESHDHDKEGDSWGYNDKAHSPEELEERIIVLMDMVNSVKYFEGFCYTQFTDVQQEANGLLTEDRIPKIPLKELYDIFSRD